MTDRELNALILEHNRHYLPLLAVPRMEWHQVSHKINGAITRYRALIRAIERLAPQPGNALEVGVGHGIPLLLYARLFPRLDWHGVDAPWTSVAHPDLAPLIPKIRFCNLEADAIPFNPNTFTCAVLSEVAEHLPPPAFAHALRQCFQVLAPGGVLFVTSPNLVSLMNRLIFLAGCSPFHLPIRSPKYGGGFPHIHLYTAREATALGRAVGFESAAIEHHTYFTYALIENKRWRNAILRVYLALELCMGRLRPSLRDGWLVALRKPAALAPEHTASNGTV